MNDVIAIFELANVPGGYGVRTALPAAETIRILLLAALKLYPQHGQVVVSVPSPIFLSPSREGG